MIKVILFDVGGTYLKGSAKNFVRKAHQILGIKAKNRVNEAVFDPEYNKGKIPIEEFFEKYFGIPIPKASTKKLVHAWTHNWKTNSGMKSLVLRLKKNYRLGTLSNSDLVNFNIGLKEGRYEPFEALTMSHELGILKPGPTIYRIALKKMKAKANECLFIDDQKTCLKTAQKLGMKTIWFRSIKQLKKDLKRLGIQY